MRAASIIPWITATILWAVPAVAETRLDAHRRLTAQFMSVLEKDGVDAALAFAKQRLNQVAGLPKADPRRTDALELMVLAQMERESWGEMLAAAEDVVKRRKGEKPIEPELLGLALGNQGVAQFALHRAADADRTFREQMDVWRAAFGPDDIALALKLEGQARYVQEPHLRWRTASELYKEALAVRKKHPNQQIENLAQTYQSLALMQIQLAEYEEADANNTEAERVMELAIDAAPQVEELKAGLVQMLVVHAGIENRRGPANKADALLTRAREIAFTNKELEAEGEFLILMVQAQGLEFDGDFEGARAKSMDAIQLAIDHNNLTDMIPDVMRQIGELSLKSNDIPGANDAFTRLLQMVGGESNVDASLLFDLSELARLEDRPEEQKRLYQRALQSRKVTAAETVVFFGTNRAPSAGTFGNQRSSELSFGEIVVQVPGGSFAPEASLRPYQRTPVPVGKSTDVAHLSITAKTTVDVERFPDLVTRRAAAARLYDGSVLVFIHGYNNSFDDAVRRTAQLVRDLNFDGAAFSFAWPSRGSFMRYGSDLNTAALTVDACAEFLTRVAKATGAAKIHVIAHSMGNRILLPALTKLPLPLRARFGEIVLASPAVDPKSFHANLDLLVGSGMSRFTLYASSRDKALRAGFYREFGTTLAGFVSRDEPILHAGVQSIDVSEAGNAGDYTNLNHDIFATNPTITEDMRQLLQMGTRPPDKRLPNMEQRVGASRVPFWYYRLSY